MSLEQSVGAYLLSQLLVGATPPVLIDCSVVEISFQNEYRGWNTDDFLLIGRLLLAPHANSPAK